MVETVYENLNTCRWVGSAIVELIFKICTTLARSVWDFQNHRCVRKSAIFEKTEILRGGKLPPTLKESGIILQDWMWGKHTRSSRRLENFLLQDNFFENFSKFRALGDPVFLSRPLYLGFLGKNLDLAKSRYP